MEELYQIAGDPSKSVEVRNTAANKMLEMLASALNRVDVVEKPRTFGDEIRDFRRGAGLTQAQFSSLLGVAQGYVSMWERDKSKPSGKTLVVLKTLMGV